MEKKRSYVSALTAEVVDARMSGDCDDYSKRIVQEGYELRKLTLSATLLAMALVVAAPAMAQSVSQVVQSRGGNVSCSVSTQNGQT
ncbi:MAG: hypothetical protein M3M97_03895, partial [Actinomycetota bacterium]|nr:hypothetical protein [Actinomycetota bacterium]